jgi:uncharacterized membrane protein
MVNELKRADRYYETVFLGAVSLLCFALSIFRVIYTGTPMFLFLNWNLFLAFVPWALSGMLILVPAWQNSKPAALVVMATWLLFFPNAPYILTDLFHLSTFQGIPKWFDLILILSFAWTGLLFGLLSLTDIEKVLSKWMRPLFVHMTAILLLFTGSFGVYIGRFLRWNSWDIVTNPADILSDVADRIINPTSHPSTWGMTILLGVFLTLTYYSMRVMRRRNVVGQAV